jgi:hypothetical protein
VWNWTVYFWGANCVKLDCIGLVRGKFCLNVLFRFGGGKLCRTVL